MWVSAAIGSIVVLVVASCREVHPSPPTPNQGPRSWGPPSQTFHIETGHPAIRFRVLSGTHVVRVHARCIGGRHGEMTVPCARAVFLAWFRFDQPRRPPIALQLARDGKVVDANPADQSCLEEDLAPKRDICSIHVEETWYRQAGEVELGARVFDVAIENQGPEQFAELRLMVFDPHER